MDEQQASRSLFEWCSEQVAKEGGEAPVTIYALFLLITPTHHSTHHATHHWQALDLASSFSDGQVLSQLCNSIAPPLRPCDCGLSSLSLHLSILRVHTPPLSLLHSFFRQPGDLTQSQRNTHTPSRSSSPPLLRTCSLPLSLPFPQTLSLPLLPA